MDHATADAALIRRQQERIDYLEEENRQLREAKPRAPELAFPMEWGLAPGEARALSALPSSSCSCVEVENVVKVRITRLRRAFERIDKRLRIFNRYGLGYLLTADHRAIVKAKLEESQLAA